MTRGSRTTVVGRALGDQPAVVEHGEMVDQLHHRLHRVLDDQHCHAVARATGGSRRGCRRDRRGRAPPGSRRAASAAVAAPARAPAPSAAVRASSARRRSRRRRAPSPTRSSAAQRHSLGGRVVGRADKGADDDIFEHGHAREGAHDLKGAADAAPAHLARPQPDERLAGKADRAAIAARESR